MLSVQYLLQRIVSLQFSCSSGNSFRTVLFFRKWFQCSSPSKNGFVAVSENGFSAVLLSCREWLQYSFPSPTGKQDEISGHHVDAHCSLWAHQLPAYSLPVIREGNITQRSQRALGATENVQHGLCVYFHTVFFFIWWGTSELCVICFWVEWYFWYPSWI